MSPQLKLSLILGSDRTRSGGGRFYARAANLRGWLRAAYDRALADVDFLVLPTTPVVAHPVDDALDVPTRVMRSWALVANTAPTDLTGHPATSLPLARSNGLPVGLMFVARHSEDARLLALARSLEHTIGWAA
jgi:amidase